jgi:hypothetical protein
MSIVNSVKNFSKSTKARLGKNIIFPRIDLHYEAKAQSENFLGRFREIVSDPINLLIHRDGRAGYVDEDLNVFLHNGNKVKCSGLHSYYGNFSELLINRGVHEPLEEYIFQELLKVINTENPLMIEMGSYWAHYSMWLQQKFPMAKNIMIDADQTSLEAGKFNFKNNNFFGNFILAKIGNSNFELDTYVLENDVHSIDILHSDIQGYELEMLDGARKSLEMNKVNYIFISTHSERLHCEVIDRLKSYNYRVEVSSPFEEHTTSGDGIIFASSPVVGEVFKNGFEAMGRRDILKSQPVELLKYLNNFNKTY